jgi:hypothetical protein
MSRTVAAKGRRSHEAGIPSGKGHGPVVVMPRRADRLPPDPLLDEFPEVLMDANYLRELENAPVDRALHGAPTFGASLGAFRDFDRCPRDSPTNPSGALTAEEAQRAPATHVHSARGRHPGRAS